MQQIEDEYDNLDLIQQGNNSFIHRARIFSGPGVECQVIKSVFHSQILVEKVQTKSSYHQRECEDLTNEWQILQKLNHPHIIKPYAFVPNNNITVRGTPVQCCSLKIESAFCDLFNMCKGSELSPLGDSHLPFKSIIQYFKQIGSALEYLHSQQIAHNDIKLENILVFSRETVKLADFGFAYKITCEPRDLASKWLPRSLNAYTSPEIVHFRNELYEKTVMDSFLQKGSSQQLNDVDFSPLSADVFALSTSLFISIYRRTPIYNQYPSLNDPLYSMLTGNPDHFWDLEPLQNVEKDLYERDQVGQEQLENLRDLLEQGLAEEDQRLTIEEWMNHEFWNEDFEVKKPLEEQKK